VEVFAWPGAVIILGIVFMIIFHKPLANLIDRIKEVGRDGIKTDFQQSLQKDVIPTTPKAEAEKLMRAFDSLLLQEQEKAILKDLDEKGLKDRNETVEVLVRHLAGTQLDLYFERINSRIWGSQVFLLQELNSSATPIPEEMLTSYYEEAAKRYPVVYKNYTFQNYLDFLHRVGLIIKQDSAYQIKG
jgi:hypothetical protein